MKFRVGDLVTYGNPGRRNPSLGVVTGDNTRRDYAELDHYEFWHVEWVSLQLTEKKAGFFTRVEVPK